jgi:hypothetical protein
VAVTTIPLFPTLNDADIPRKISPTDVSQFIRLDQCERYLRLRLHERAEGQKFLYDYGVAPQSIPPILTQSGADFEATIETAVHAAAKATSCKVAAVPGTRKSDNALVVEHARSLTVGEVEFLFQPRLEVDLDGWFVRGDVDIVRLERDSAGELRVIIADMKSSTSAKLEHRLQVGFYHEMLDRIFRAAGLPYAEIRTAILYRGPEAEGDPAQRALAQELFHTDSALLELVPNPEDYRDSVRDLVTGNSSVANRVASVSFDDLTFHLSFKCDGCLYNSFCMKWSAERDDLSVLPHLHESDKKALHKHGVTTTSALAQLKQFAAPDSPELIAAPGQEQLIRQLSTTWPIGPRLDEVIHRARRYRSWKKDDLRSLSYIPSKGYGSLPYCAPDHNPNLVKIYIDAQFDYLHDRAYMFGALLVGYENGVVQPERRRSVVRIASGPPETPEAEQELLVEWINAVITDLAMVAAPDADGRLSAPIHLIFFNALEQQIVLDALARHFAVVLGATPLYDFMTQIAAFDSSLLTYLDNEIRELKNYPMVCQSLQAVASYLRFDWNVGENYREIFYRRVFDDRGQLSSETEEWYTSRARFSSHIPLEYAYAAWNALPPPKSGDDFADYRAATVERLTGFHARRLEALEHIANDFRGNRQTQKTAFALPDLATFSGVARTLAQALTEFVTIERHVELAAWKSARLPPPERRVLAGTTFIVRYCHTDQAPDLLATLRENERRHALRQRYTADFLAANPKRKRATLTPDQKAETEEIPLPAPYRLRFDLTDVDCDLDQALLLTTIRSGDRMVMAPRWDVDSRLPASEQVPYTPTPKQLLYAARADIANIVVERDSAGHATAAFVEVWLPNFSAQVKDAYRSFVFGGRQMIPQDGVVYTLDDDPNSWYGYWCAVMVDAVRAGGSNTLHERLNEPAQGHVTWPTSAAEAQARFLAGIDALHAAGAAAAPSFDAEVRRYIAQNGDAPTLLVQGPPGTGKSYTSAFALFARLQGALTAGIDRRVFITCKTHAATDVLLEKIVELQEQLRQWRTAFPAIFDQFIDARLLNLPLFRMAPREGVPASVFPLRRNRDRQPGDPQALEAVLAERWCIVATTPGGTYGMLKDAGDELTGHVFAHCLVLDEASQMNLPEALLAAAPLARDGQLIVVGDDRQMPPIVKHDWANERRRTFQQYHAYESLFATLRAQNPPMIKFAESFRLHTTMAAFLRREIYDHDGIAYFSRRTDSLPAMPLADPFVASVLSPEYPLVVIVHDEAGSQQQNLFEQQLAAPILAVLADPANYGLNATSGLGVVVPHRAQRAALQSAIPALTVRDPATGLITVSAVDTVERFQGGERTVVLVSATESDRDYLRSTGDFLLDPRRLNVALSRAKQKMILVASRSVFTIFSTDEDTFANAQIWKNLLRRTCTEQLWQGEQQGVRVEVWGNMM